MSDTYNLELYILERNEILLQKLEEVQQHLEQVGNIKSQLEIVDLNARPEQASEQQILAIPTLIKKNPPTIRIIGNIDDIEQVARVLTGTN